MKWCCFLFWFVYRLILACLPFCCLKSPSESVLRFLAVYTNCVYFTLWKSYDLLWFWMHLTLCSCFQSLRRENYIVVWSNLIYKRYTKYANRSYKVTLESRWFFLRLFTSFGTFIFVSAFDILAPNYTNTYDILDEKKRERRAKRDRKALTQRLRRRRREELRELARQERRRKKIADSIELLLQLLRMMTSFAVLVGNIRKTFIPAQFKYLKPGQHAYDNYELLLLFRVTTFLDVSMFWTNVMWVYCLQWHLCCRLGLLRFWVWLAILSFVAIVVMLAPMSYAMNKLDLSWCRFRINSTLEKYQPKW
ncbi:unnamed protein product [Angiostrongylus costaricensis]|uniref:G_PROTEIN_RECEP_F1_2 domain-containing protein n=1 Tax=Angiostrongylus costaricensis TaxID=334426 RepID=A0A0R3Q0Y3_ANGCS|nr:unnamed protein product [Angiostrongylus costaricensis]